MREISMFRFSNYEDEIRVPGWVHDLESFRRWCDDDAFPENAHISFLKGEVWVDMSKEQLFTHNDVKAEFNLVIRGLAKSLRIGRSFTDGAYLSSVEADVSNQPDGCFVSTEAIKEERVRIIEGVSSGHVELEGAPDMVLEVVSASSVEKDTIILRQAYAEAGIPEYWLVDARSEPLQFDLLRLTKRGYVSARKQGDWRWSEVFKNWFRLQQQSGDDGFPEFALDATSDKPAK